MHSETDDTKPQNDDNMPACLRLDTLTLEILVQAFTLASFDRQDTK